MNNCSIISHACKILGEKQRLNQENKNMYLISYSVFINKSHPRFHIF